MIPRREFLKRCATGFGGLALTSLLEDERQPRPHHVPRVRSVIFLYMDGGVSQVDSFDPKPELEKYNGKPFPAKMEPTQFNNIGNSLGSLWKYKNYGECGTPVSDLFPHIAQHVDDMAVVRSMISNFPEHTNANYFVRLMMWKPNPVSTTLSAS